MLHAWAEFGRLFRNLARIEGNFLKTSTPLNTEKLSFKAVLKSSNAASLSVTADVTNGNVGSATGKKRTV